MYSKYLIFKVKDLYASGQSVTFISRNLDLSKPTVSYMIKNDYNRSKSNRGPGGKWIKYEESRIKMKISVIQKSNERVTGSKLKINLALAVTKCI